MNVDHLWLAVRLGLGWSVIVTSSVMFAMSVARCVVRLARWRGTAVARWPAAEVPVSFLHDVREMWVVVAIARDEDVTIVMKVGVKGGCEGEKVLRGWKGRGGAS